MPRSTGRPSCSRRCPAVCWHWARRPPARAAGRPLIGETVRVADVEKAVQAITGGGPPEFILAVVDAAR